MSKPIKRSEPAEVINQDAKKVKKEIPAASPAAKIKELCKVNFLLLIQTQ